MFRFGMKAEQFKFRVKELAHALRVVLDAFEGAIARGESLGDALKSLGRDLANLALNQVKTGGRLGSGRQTALA